MKRFFAIVVLAMALVAVVALTGCSTSTPATTPAATPPASSDASASAPAGAQAAVSIVNMAYAPEQLIIQVGDTITWTNNDTVAHTVTGADFDSGPMQPGATFSYTFSKAGTFDYKCTIHPQMLARVTVQ